jgi:hypothetical protein
MLLIQGFARGHAFCIFASNSSNIMAA